MHAMATVSPYVQEPMILRTLGIGAYGRVVLARDGPECSVDLAMKFARGTTRKNVLWEAAILRKVAHAHVIRLFDVRASTPGGEEDPCDLPRRSHAQTEARANSDSNTSTETATSTATATTAIFARKLTHGRTRPSSNGVEPWSHGMEPWLFRPMAWSHRLFRPQPMAWSHGGRLHQRQTDSISDYGIIILEHAS